MQRKNNKPKDLGLETQCRLILHWTATLNTHLNSAITGFRLELAQGQGTRTVGTSFSYKDCIAPLKATATLTGQANGDKWRILDMEIHNAMKIHVIIS